MLRPDSASVQVRVVPANQTLLLAGEGPAPTSRFKWITSEPLDIVATDVEAEPPAGVEAAPSTAAAYNLPAVAGTPAALVVARSPFLYFNPAERYAETQRGFGWTSKATNLDVHA